MRKTSSARRRLIWRGFGVHFRRCRKRPVRTSLILSSEPKPRQVEFHQLERRWEHLRVRDPRQQRRLLASLAESGQQTPIVVVVSSEGSERYIVIDGYKRIAALEQLRLDSVEVTVWEMSEAEALLLDRSLRLSPHETALEQAWLLAKMEQHFHYSLDELARRFDRSVSWVSRRLALVELLPEAIQQQVREGKLGAQLARKYLVPVARISLEQCERMAAAFVQCRCDSRQAAQLYRAWREASPAVRRRILADPGLFLKTQRPLLPENKSAATELQRDLEIAVAVLRRAGRRLSEALPEMSSQQREQAQRQIESARRDLEPIAERLGREHQIEDVEPGATKHDSGVECEWCPQTRDCAGAESITPERAQGTALEIHRGAGNAPCAESGALPATDPRSFEHLPGEPRASP
jgi:ParB family transcriptional regulator, chromosome partitioning protein